MQIVLQGNYLGSKTGKTKNNESYYIVSVLSGDSAVRVSFDNDTLEIFKELSTKSRFEEVAILCDLNIYNGNAYIHALPY